MGPRAVPGAIVGTTLRTLLVRVALPMANAAVARCGRCRRWGARLGFGGRVLGQPPVWCAPCLEALVAACVGRHGRLPDPAREFYCPRCAGLCPDTARSPADKDGRRRLVCRPCRRAELAAADRRSATRRPAAPAPPPAAARA